MDLAASWAEVAPTVALSKATKSLYNIDDAKPIGNVQSISNASKPMAQVQHALSHIRGGKHTVTISVDWHIREYVRDGIDETKDLTTALTITGEPHAAYACSYEEYVKFAWQKYASITKFFRDFAASRFISSAEACKSQIESTLAFLITSRQSICLLRKPAYCIRRYGIFWFLDQTREGHILCNCRKRLLGRNLPMHTVACHGLPAASTRQRTCLWRNLRESA
jgi:hypothetical protein